VQLSQTRPQAASSSVVAFAAYIWNSTAEIDYQPRRIDSLANSIHIT